MGVAVNPELETFARDNVLVGLTAPSLRAALERRPGYCIGKARRFLVYQERIDKELLQHCIISANRYTAWFKQGEQTHEQIKAFVVQFSVFSNLFLIAQLYKMIHADSLEGMRASKEMLANEIGVVFKPWKKGNAKLPVNDAGTDLQLVSH